MPKRRQRVTVGQRGFAAQSRLHETAGLRVQNICALLRAANPIVQTCHGACASDAFAVVGSSVVAPLNRFRTVRDSNVAKARGLVARAGQSLLIGRRGQPADGRVGVEVERKGIALGCGRNHGSTLQI